MPALFGALDFALLPDKIKSWKPKMPKFIGLESMLKDCLYIYIKFKKLCQHLEPRNKTCVCSRFLKKKFHSRRRNFIRLKALTKLHDLMVAAFHITDQDCIQIRPQLVNKNLLRFCYLNDITRQFLLTVLCFLILFLLFIVFIPKLLRCFHLKKCSNGT